MKFEDNLKNSTKVKIRFVHSYFLIDILFIYLNYFSLILYEFHIFESNNIDYFYTYRIQNISLDHSMGFLIKQNKSLHSTIKKFKGNGYPVEL